MFRSKLEQDEHIFSLLLGDVVVGRAMSCPYRHDASPSFVLYEKDDRLYWHDFAATEKFNRTAFGLAMKMWDKSPQEVAQIIKTRPVQRNIIREPVSIKGITCGSVFTPDEQKYMSSRCIKDKVLRDGCVYGLRGFYINDDFSFASKKHNPAFAYVFGKHSWQIYRPLEIRSKKFRSHNINGVLFGRHMLSGGDILIITSSYKDVLTLRSLGYDAICPSSEGVLSPIYNNYGMLSLMYKDIYVLFDNDKTGISRALELCSKTCIKPIFLPDMYNTGKLLKDPSDITFYTGGHLVIGDIIRKFTEKKQYDRVCKYKKNSSVLRMWNL